MKLLLDTHVLLFWVQGDPRLSRTQRKALASASGESPVLVSDISLWEIATLLLLRRIVLDRPLREWLERAVAPPLVERCGISPAVAAELQALPSSFHRDPADRLIVATARVHGATLLTFDRRIIEARVVETLG